MTSTRIWPYPALTFAVAYGVLRLSWALGGRLGYSACAQNRTYPAHELATGCRNDWPTELPFPPGWGAVALAGLLVAVTAWTVLRRGRLPAAAAWAGSAVLVALSFPGHLLFEIPVALAGEPADWRQLAHRALLLGGGLLVGAAAASAMPPGCGHPRTREVRRAPRWVRWSAYAGCAVPVLGFTVPHALWAFGVPFGIDPTTLRELLADVTPGVAFSLCAAPAVGGLLTLGLGMRWGQVFPRWLPYVGGRLVPRPVALVPAAVVALALVVYGVLGLVLIGGALVEGTTNWSELAAGWAVVGTEVVFLLWGVCLSLATAGYALLTRPRCDRCPPASPSRAPSSRHRPTVHRIPS